MPEKFQETHSRVENQSNLMLFLRSQMAEGFFASGYSSVLPFAKTGPTENWDTFDRVNLWYCRSYKLMTIVLVETIAITLFKGARSRNFRQFQH